MRRREFTIRLAALSFSFCVPVPRFWLHAGELHSNHKSPSDAARALFEAFKRQDLPAFVALFHSEAVKQFHSFAIDVFKYEAEDAQVEAIRKLFAPFHSRDAVEAASGTEVMTAFLKNTMAQIEGLDDLLADAELQILGEIAEPPDKVHVITRTFSPRPSPVTCQKHEGRWYQLLNEEQLRLINAVAQKKQFAGKEVDAAEIRQRSRLASVNVIGHVADGEGLAQVLCRTQMKIDDFALAVLGCYPVRKGEPAWELLNVDDEDRLVAALRAKWERVEAARP